MFTLAAAIEGSHAPVMLAFKSEEKALEVARLIVKGSVEVHDDYGQTAFIVHKRLLALTVLDLSKATEKAEDFQKFNEAYVQAQQPKGLQQPAGVARPTLVHPMPTTEQ